MSNNVCCTPVRKRLKKKGWTIYFSRPDVENVMPTVLYTSKQVYFVFQMLLIQINLKIYEREEQQ